MNECKKCLEQYKIKKLENIVNTYQEILKDSYRLLDYRKKRIRRLKEKIEKQEEYIVYLEKKIDTIQNPNF